MNRNAPIAHLGRYEEGDLEATTPQGDAAAFISSLVGESRLSQTSRSLGLLVGDRMRR